MWKLATGATQCTLDARAAYKAAAWAPTGDRVAVAGDDGFVRVGDIAACAGGAALPVRTLGTPRGRVSSVAAGKDALLGDSTGRVSAWDTTSWQLAQSTPVHAGEVLSIAPLPDGRWVSGGTDRTVMLGGDGTPRTLATLRGSALSFAALPEGTAVLAGDFAGNVTEIPPAGNESVLWTAPRPVYGLAVEPSGTSALAGGAWSTVVGVPLSTGGKRTEWPNAFSTREAGTAALAFLPDGRFVQASTRGDVLVRRGETVEKRLTGLTREVSALAVTSPHLWAGGWDKALVRWTLDGALEPDRRIDEGAKIHRLAATTNGFLVAGLSDGRASVRRLPDGELVAHLYPFRDGSGATVFADGHFVATPGDAYALRFENPATRQVVTLGELLELRVTTPLVTPLPDGSVAVRATIFSPGGPPTVTLDGGWSIEAVTPSRTELLAYDVDLQLVEPRGGKHTLTAQPPEGKAVSAPFEILPDPRFSKGKTRALVIGNSAYEHRAKLPGAAKDAALVRAFLAEHRRLAPLRRSHRSAPQSHEHRDRHHHAARRGDGVLRTRGADETLFFYFSGHGDSDATNRVSPAGRRPRQLARHKRSRPMTSGKPSAPRRPRASWWSSTLAAPASSSCRAISRCKARPWCSRPPSPAGARPISRPAPPSRAP